MAVAVSHDVQGFVPTPARPDVDVLDLVAARWTLTGEHRADYVGV